MVMVGEPWRWWNQKAQSERHNQEVIQRIQRWINWKLTIIGPSYYLLFRVLSMTILITPSESAFMKVLWATCLASLPSLLSLNLIIVLWPPLLKLQRHEPQWSYFIAGIRWIMPWLSKLVVPLNNLVNQYPFRWTIVSFILIVHKPRFRVTNFGPSGLALFRL